MISNDNSENYDDDTDVLFIEMETVAFSMIGIIFLVVTCLKTCFSYIKIFFFK